MPLDTRQWNLPLALNPKACFEDMSARFQLPDAAELQAHCLQPPPFKSLLWSHHDKETPYGKRFSLSDMRSWCTAAAAATTPHGGSQKGLTILDQTGNQTRLVHCPFPLTAEPVKLSESEMHEDTEEINALLYSDDDYDEDCESGDDEVMSTAHSPYQVCNKRQLEETDGSCKRQKLLDKVSVSSSLVCTSTKEDTGSGLSNEQSRKDKIRTALKILESIVPGAKGNEALLLLDEAIDYLKLLKQDLISTEIKA